MEKGFSNKDWAILILSVAIFCGIFLWAYTFFRADQVISNCQDKLQAELQAGKTYIKTASESCNLVVKHYDQFVSGFLSCKIEESTCSQRCTDQSKGKEKANDLNQACQALGSFSSCFASCSDNRNSCEKGVLRTITSTTPSTTILPQMVGGCQGSGNGC
ncbi:MAG: hypothetical protein WC595_00875 [Candidatus Nanoarchaeia archaeon]